MRIYELTPTGYDRAKSFYGKAKVIEKDGETVLQSYDTQVCKISASGEFVRMWSGYSVTTMRHINSFIEMFGIEGGEKKVVERAPRWGKQAPRRRYDPRRKFESNVRKTRRELLRR